MTLPRAIIIAITTSIMLRGDGGAVDNLCALLLGGVLWLFTNDPMPDAIKRGLEAFAKDYRR